MKNRVIALAAMYIIVILFVICVLTVITEDRVAPRIIFGNEEPIYIESEGTKALLTNVSAVDEEEGDVSNTLAVESIRVLSNGKKASVIYVARDSKNNIVKVSRIIKYQGLAKVEPVNGTNEAVDIPSDAEAAITTSTDTTEVSNAEGTDNTQSSENQEEDIAPEEADEGPLVSTGDPIIKLNTNSVTITAGDNFNVMNYIKEAVDDKDDAWRRILIKGDYSTEEPGEYSILFSITDSDGNKSNVETLTLIVE